MDREHKRHGAEVKRLFVYPLVPDAHVKLLGRGINGSIGPVGGEAV
jgi:hypothetical protein